MNVRKIPTGKVQLELELLRPHEEDRNFDKGGRSFYFFDFDDNILNLLTPIVLFKKKTRKEVLISSQTLAVEGRNIGKSGRFEHYYFDYDDVTGSFRFFRDTRINFFQKLFGKKQSFVNDVWKALKRPDEEWKGPSWNYFFHATYNKRPISIITARGHDPETIKKGIDVLVSEGHIAYRPNYLSVFPVSNKGVRTLFGDSDYKFSVASLKKIAIRKSVEAALLIYGNNPHHRFGMSDDDPHNIELIIDAMVMLKKEYPTMSFFVFDTHDGEHCIRKEIFENHFKETELETSSENFESSLMLDF